MTRLDKAVDGPMRQHMKYSDGRYIPKKDFRTRGEALGSRAAEADPTLVAYQCEVCGRWHLGHEGD